MNLKRFSMLLLLCALSAVTVGAAAGTQPTRAGAAAAPSPLDGRWTATVTQAQLRRAGATPALVAKLHGRYSARYGNGRFEFHNHRTGAVARGTFGINRNVARVVFASGVGVKPGQVSTCTWSIYRDRLTFKRIPGRPSLLCDAGVWTRAS